MQPSLLLKYLYTAVRDGEHDAVFAIEGDGRMCRAGFVQAVLACAVLADTIAIAALQDEYFLESDMAMRGIAATWLHANQHSRITIFFVATKKVKEDAFMSG